jgi:hypothetical protein
MVCTVGNLQPDKPEFREYLARYLKNPLFSGSVMGIFGEEILYGRSTILFLLTGSETLCLRTLPSTRRTQSRI